MADLGPSQNEEQAINQGFSCTLCLIPDPCPLGLLVQNVYAKFFSSSSLLLFYYPGQ